MLQQSWFREGQWNFPKLQKWKFSKIIQRENLNSMHVAQINLIKLHHVHKTPTEFTAITYYSALMETWLLLAFAGIVSLAFLLKLSTHKRPAPPVENVHGKIVGRSATRHQKSDAEHHIFLNIIWHLLISDFLWRPRCTGIYSVCLSLKVVVVNQFL